MKIYNIGDQVWCACTGTKEKSKPCPECFGKKYLTVILGDDSQVTIPCAGCAAGFDPSKGYVTYFEYSIDVFLGSIEKVEIERGGVSYSMSNHYYFKDDEVFETKEEAEVKAKEKADKFTKQELARIHRKDIRYHTWSWHVHYHRKQIRDCEETLKYAKKNLDAAKIKSKTEGGD